MRLRAAIVGVLLAAVCAPALAQRPECAAELNYDNADIRAVVDEIALRTGRTFLLDPRVQGSVSVKSPPGVGLCPDEAWELFQAMLRVNGFTATPVGAGRFKIVPVQEGPRAAGPVGEGSAGDLVTQIVHLRYVDAREAAATIAQIVNERGVVSPVRTGNALIIVDSADNAARLRQVLEQLDRDVTVFRTLQLRNASALEVARVVSGLAREMSEESPQASKVAVVPVEANNSILLRAHPAMLGRLSEVITELDRIGESRSALAVVHLNNADAEELAPLLREIIDSQNPPGGEAGAPAAGPRASVTSHRATNSIIIHGNPEIQKMLENVIAQLDVRRAQVLVEAIIVEISDSTARELGLQYFLSGTGGSRVPFSTTNFSSIQPNALALAGAALLESGTLPSGSIPDSISEAALTSLLGLNGFALGGAGQIGDNSVFGAILTAIKQDMSSNVLSTPSVVTMDNMAAELSVGQEIPITTGETAGVDLSNVFRTITREEVGVILKVTPQINAGGTVRLQISQEISSVAGQIISTSTDLITNKRRIETTALVDDGEILVIGGLIDEVRENRASKVPGLGDIPVAGNLFRTTARSKERRNLMVFLRPTILRDRDTANAATRRKMDYIRARDMLYRGEAASDLDRLIEQATGLGPASGATRGLE